MSQSTYFDSLIICKKLEQAPRNAVLRFMEWLVFEHSEILDLQISMEGYCIKYDVEYGEIIAQPISNLEFYNRGTYLESLLLESDSLKEKPYDFVDYTEAEINDRCKYDIADFLSVYIANRYSFHSDSKIIDSNRYQLCLNTQSECLDVFVHQSQQMVGQPIKFRLEHFHRLYEN